MHNRGYVLAAILGAIGGGLVVALATKAVPRIMSQMMHNMMTHMREGGFDPSDMWQRMMAGFGEAQQKEMQNHG